MRLCGTTSRRRLARGADTTDQSNRPTSAATIKNRATHTLAPCHFLLLFLPLLSIELYRAGRLSDTFHWRSLDRPFPSRRINSLPPLHVFVHPSSATHPILLPSFLISASLHLILITFPSVILPSNITRNSFSQFLCVRD